MQAKSDIIIRSESSFSYVRLTHIVYKCLTSYYVLDFSIKRGASGRSGPADSQMHRACVEIAPISRRSVLWRHRSQSTRCSGEGCRIARGRFSRRGNSKKLKCHSSKVLHRDSKLTVSMYSRPTTLRLTSVVCLGKVSVLNVFECLVAWLFIY